MSSTERAPEPTMEEILASIRRIITDDETGQARAQKAAPRAQQDDESLEGEADSQIIDDIARVLSGSAGQAPADEEEEILDLAGELGLEIVEETEEVIEVLEFEQVEGTAPDAEMTLDEMMLEVVEPDSEAPEFAPEPRAFQEMAPPPQMAVPQPPVPPQAPAAEPAQAQAPQAQAPAPQAQQPKPSASLEAASALERAIAALRAGQVPTSTSPQAEPFKFQAAPQPEAMAAPEPMPMPEQMAAPEPAPIPMAVPMEAPEAHTETYPDMEPGLAAQAEPSFEPEAMYEPMYEPMAEAEQEPELMLTEVEMTVVEAEEPEVERAPFWPVEAEAEEQPAEPAFEPEPELERVMAQVNGGGAHHEGASRTLEDSIKDMLRPMLREWLDENMPRIVREMDPDPLRRHRD